MQKEKMISHSKLKNTGILFEVLIRQITVDTLDKRNESPALRLMGKYLIPNTELGKELQLYRAITETKNLTESRAIKLLDLIGEQRKKLNERLLTEQKYNLVKELRASYNITSLMKIKIPSYKIYASAYKTFLSESTDYAIANIKDIAMSRFTLIEHMIGKSAPSKTISETSAIDIFKNQTEDLRLLGYKLLLEKFNDKYSMLGDKQKQLLREYIYSISNSDAFTNYVHKEIDPLCEVLVSLASKERNKVTQIKLNEVASQLKKFKNHKQIRDNELTALMVAYQLVEELKIKK